MVNSCPLVSPCLYGGKNTTNLWMLPCCPHSSALWQFQCCLQQSQKKKSRPLLTVLDSYSTGNEIWQRKMSPLALSRSKIRIKRSSTLITQHSELLSAAYNLTIQVCQYFFFLVTACPLQHSSPIYDPELQLAGWLSIFITSPSNRTPLQAQALWNLRSVPSFSCPDGQVMLLGLDVQPPPLGQPMALMHCCGSGWMWISVWNPSLIFPTVVGSRRT